MSEMKKLFIQGDIWSGRTSVPKSSNLREISSCAPFGVPELDQTLSYQGLRFGVIHEWILENAVSRSKPKLWVPPVLMFATLIKNALEHHAKHENLPSLENKLIVFIGRRCWPSADILNQIFSEFSKNSKWQWHKRILFIDPPTAALSFKAIIETLKNPGVAVVCAESLYYSMAATRRLQLAAKEGQSLGLIATAPNRQSNLSAAYSRWRLTAAPSKNLEPSWQLERLRCRENPEQISCHIRWCFDETRKTHSLHLSSPVVNRHRSSQAAVEASDFALRQKAS